MSTIIFQTLIVSLCINIIVCQLNSCPDGFTNDGDSCYFIGRDKASWGEAEIYCKAAGAELLWIENQAEQQFISGWLSNSNGYSEDFWTSGNDLRNDGTWVWGHDASIELGTDNNNGPYTQWHHNQPDKGDHVEENCMEITRRWNWEWNDQSCDDRQSFICKIKLVDGEPEIIG